MNTQTPETDAFIEGLRQPGYGEAMPRYWDFTRKLERERNEARAIARQEKEHHEFYRQKCSDYMGAEQGWLKVQAERDALRRKVAAADGMAKALEGTRRLHVMALDGAATIPLREFAVWKDSRNAALAAWQEENR